MRLDSSDTMANRPHTPAACVNEHIRVTYKNTKKATNAKYEAVLININGILRDNGLELNPRRIEEDDIRFLLEYWGDKVISTRNWYLHILNRYLKFYGNNIVENMEINLGYNDRPNVDWLSDEECVRLMQAPKTLWRMSSSTWSSAWGYASPKSSNSMWVTSTSAMTLASAPSRSAARVVGRGSGGPSPSIRTARGSSGPGWRSVPR